MSESKHSPNKESGNFKVNIHLQAAAPDLLAACKALRQRLLDINGPEDFHVQQATAAIAKAEQATQP